jgi:hypothetical protein
MSVIITGTAYFSELAGHSLPRAPMDDIVQLLRQQAELALTAQLNLGAQEEKRPSHKSNTDGLDRYWAKRRYPNNYRGRICMFPTALAW